ncbi:uncharacterized protein LOC107049467 isoform X1 [Gallus gallus]|uniref:uncharacterized protein LOC107049467 isoform X1 n=1 Tax=Gallus gallus TaxID=9031 RepID=UPI001AE90ABA|nr:uncharacterized protein LOC107049467 isoform X1 [Gallus gallus]
MRGQSEWAMPSPRVPAFLLLVVVGTGVSTQNTCISRADGTLQAPVLFLNASSAQEGEVVLARCVFQKQFPATRIVLCKDGLEVYSVKVQEGTVMSSMLLNITERSAGTYTCFYQQRSTKNRLRSSPLSAPLDLQVTARDAIERGWLWKGHLVFIPWCRTGALQCPGTESKGTGWPWTLYSLGHVSDSTGGTAPTDPDIQWDSTVTVVASMTVTLLLSAATFWTIKKGACRERCRRQQHVPSQQMEATDYGEIQYATVVHFQRDKKNGKS